MFMSFKLLKLHWNIFFWIFTGKIKKLQSRLNIHPKQVTPENILIVFPIDEPSFRVALYSFRNLEKTESIHYYFLINTIHKQHFHLGGYAFDVSQNINNGKIKIDETFYEHRILNKKYDIVIDLNKEFIFDLSIIINNLNATYKVGIKNNYSDYFYNIQFNLNNEDILEKIYNKIFLMLK